MSRHALDQSVKIAVCEFPDKQEFKERAWAALVHHQFVSSRRTIDIYQTGPV